MKRSLIDARIEAMLALGDRHEVRFPPFAFRRLAPRPRSRKTPDWSNRWRATWR